MPKKPKAIILSEEEKDKLIADPKLALQIETIFDGLYKGKFEEDVGKVKKEIEGKITTLTTVVILGTVLVLLGIFIDYHFFKRDYNKIYLETQQQFSQEFRTMTKEISEKELEREREMDSIKARQDYLEKLLIERSTIQPAKEKTTP